MNGIVRAPDGKPNQSCGLTILYHHRTRSADGQSVHIDQLVGALRSSGHTVHIVGPRRIGATVSPLSGRMLPRFIHELLECGYNAVELCKLVWAIVRFRPDALYERANLFMLSGSWAARLFDLPFLLEVNAPLAVERSKFGGISLRRLATWTEHHAWRAANCVLPVTDVLAREIEQAGVPRSRIKVTPNGINPEEMRAANTDEAKDRLGLKNRLVLGFVGFVREWHGLEKIVDLLKAEPSLSLASLLIVGDGPASKAIRERAHAIGVGDRVLITGVVPHEALPQYISAMDIALQPEVTAYASPLKLFEYMALGRAIVAPGSDNIREVCDDGVDALLFHPGNIDSLAANIRRLAQSPELRQRLGAAASAKIRARGLTWRDNADKVARLIQGLAQRDGHGRPNPVF